WAPYRFGLDIQGGTHLVYGAEVNNISASDRAASLEAVRDIIERRINLYGVAEPLVQVEKSGSDWRLIVELAGVKDINAAIQLIGETPFLEFRTQRSDAERDAILAAQKTDEQLGEDPYFAATPLTGRFLKKASLTFGETTFEPTISLELTDEGGKIFAIITKENIGKPVAIFLDGAPISAPIVQEEITGGRAQISGSFTAATAKELVGRLNAGALPVPIKLIGQQLVGASLGEESLARSVRAGVIALIAVAAFMILWYRLPGVVAVVALLLYVGITLAIFKLIPVTMSAAGMAGFILSIGMAVDANILIFERMKEEMRAGRGLEEAVREGFSRAWTSIRDSNASSLITAAILYWFGVSVVRGFALTLGIGIIISMFSAISITRTFLLAIMTRRLQRMRFLFLNGLARR
ncbi:MAG: protein translocase subunit SecD, partial [bacterium]|nr:protein translocase subunit SecD [bacterium]MDZ4299834.1 protein translocase subunit SecD [Candidatus Sungbacteria bacterium]